METVIRHYNRLEHTPTVSADDAAKLAAMGAPITWDRTAAEQLLAWIESLTAPSVAKLVIGQRLTRDERMLFAMFLWLQNRRTPLGREWTKFLMNETGHLMALKTVGNRDLIQRHFEEIGEPKTAEEVDEWCRKTVKELEDGTLLVESTHDHEVLGTFLSADTGAEHVAMETSWIGLQAPKDSSFILSDHPLAFFDPNAASNEPVTWLSSQTVEATLPLDPSFCLLVTPGPTAYRTIRVDHAVVKEINLRTYAWAHWHIYGATVAAVQQTRANAKRHKAKVASFEPRPPGLIVSERIDGHPRPFKVTVHRPPARGSRSRRREI